MVRLFISRGQREFSAERREVAEYIRQNAVMRRFFEPFLFEELPARDVSSEQAYLWRKGYDEDTSRGTVSTSNSICGSTSNPVL